MLISAIFRSLRSVFFKTFFHCIRNISESLYLKNYCVISFFSKIIKFFLGVDCGIEVKASSLFLCQIFVNCIEKECCTKFCGNLIRFHKVIKLQSFAFSVCDVIATNVYNMSPLIFFAFFVTFMEKTPIIKFYVFDHFSGTIKLQSFEWLNCISA